METDQSSRGPFQKQTRTSCPCQLSRLQLFIEDPKGGNDVFVNAGFQETGYGRHLSRDLQARPVRDDQCEKNVSSTANPLLVGSSSLSGLPSQNFDFDDESRIVVPLIRRARNILKLFGGVKG